MRANEFITEAPLPPDWDKNVYKQNEFGEVDFDKMIAYAKARSKEIGRGSSRVAMVIPYEGRETVLKIALDTRGLAQNKAEAQVLNTSWVKQSGMAIPMIDFDDGNSSPTWIHMEKAEPLSERDAQAFFGEYGVYELVHYIRSSQEIKETMINSMFENGWPEVKIERFLEYTTFISELDNEFNVRAMDFHQTENWGVYNNMPVIIDLGFTKEVWIKYYGGQESNK